MADHPILFSAPMVRAIMRERDPKRLTRRVVMRQRHGKSSPMSTAVRTATLSEWRLHKHHPDMRDPDFQIFREPVPPGREDGRGIPPSGLFGLTCPYGKPGDRLWVRETWADVNTENGPAFLYRADQAYRFCVDDAYPVEYDRYPGCKFSMWCGDLLRGAPDHKWRPSIYMPRLASRITLEVTSVRVERVQDITEEDACAEGVQLPVVTTGAAKGKGFPCLALSSPYLKTVNNADADHAYRCEFALLWDDINGKRTGCSWHDNPWVWVVGFRRVDDGRSA